MRRFLLLALVLACATTAAAAGSSREDLVSLADHRGEVVYVDFWASWCKPCKDSFPWLLMLEREYGERGLTVLTVNVDRDREAADAFREKLGAGALPVIYDPEGKIASAYGLQGMPTAFIYGRDGTLRDTHVGFRADGKDAVEAELRDLLAEPAPEED